jgi:single-strand DNA-binding protein
MGINNFIGMGRITRDLEIKSTNIGKRVLSFSIAIQKNKDEADFIPCVAWEETADFIANYFAKGRMIAVTGTLQSRQYEKDGEKRTALEVVVRKADFTGEPKPVGDAAVSYAQPVQHTPTAAPAAPQPIPDSPLADLPF